jgi:hypothetical protein
MSLESNRDNEKQSGDGFNQKRRNADRVKERYQKNTIENLIRQAEYKNSLGMEMTDSERFVLENKGFLLRKHKLISKEG